MPKRGDLFSVASGAGDGATTAGGVIVFGLHAADKVCDIRYLEVSADENCQFWIEVYEDAGAFADGNALTPIKADGRSSGTTTAVALDNDGGAITAPDTERGDWANLFSPAYEPIPWKFDPDEFVLAKDDVLIVKAKTATADGIVTVTAHWEEL
jgi:hypothetical protein